MITWHLARLIHNYGARVSLPWKRNLAGPQRVWFAVYRKTEERRLRRRLEDFEISTKWANHGWVTMGLTDAFARWFPGTMNFPGSPEDSLIFLVDRYPAS